LVVFPCLRLHAAQSIENDRYAISVEASDGSFTVASKPGGKKFLTGGKLSGTGGTAKTIELTDKIFGKGRGIRVSYPNGNIETIALYPNLPFVLFNNSFHNGGAEPVTLNHVPTVSGAVDLGKPLAELRTLGTGGLLKPADNPGSYAFLAVVDPQTRSGVVGGWITHDRGDGVVFSAVKDDAVRVQAQIDYGRLRIKPGQDAASETFALGYFADARFGLEDFADAIARVYSIKLHPVRPGYCTWYMEKNAGSSNEKSLAELSAYAAKNLKPFGLDFIQIDDGWQTGLGGNGPMKVFSDFNPQGPYHSGMKEMADVIKGLGLTPGLWFMPFAGNYLDPFFKDHQDWFVKNTQGKPYETAWGGTCLDMTNPAAREYLRSMVQRIAHEWGYQLFKMDGFWTGSATKQVYVNDGYVNDGIGDAEFLNPDKTNIEALRDGVRLVREAAGPDVFLLGCCVSQNMRSFGGSFGLLDAMRVGPDTGAGEIGSPHASRLWFLNGKVWWNDPDCVSVRTSNTLDRARLNATFTAIAGDVFYNSDWMPDFPADRLDILRRCMPSHGLRSTPVDVFENEPARIWHLADTRGGRRDVVALYNWGKEPESVSASAERIGLPAAKQYVGFDFWLNKFVPPFEGEVKSTLPPGSCRVLAIRPVSNYPQLLSTSRHITQGMVDVTGETWDAASRTLLATSKVVANDSYELRIVVPSGANSFRATGVTVSAQDKAAGVTATFKQDGPRVRATISSPVSREIKWQVHFEKGAISAAGTRPLTGLKATADYREATLTWDDNGADRYRVTRNDGTPVETLGTTYTDRSLEKGKSYQYGVAAIGWDNTDSTPAFAKVTLAEMKRPPAPAVPNVFLDDSNTKVEQNGMGTGNFNKSINGTPLTIEGKLYGKGLGLHANAQAIAVIPTGATRFVATVGLDDEVRDAKAASVTFEVYGDVKEMGEKPVLLGQSPVLSANTLRSWAFDLDLNSRFKELRLVVTDAGDGINSDHADWGDAGFIAARAAEDWNAFEAKTFTGTQGSLPYRILPPAEIKPGTKYPLVLFLHGAGQRGDNNAGQLSPGGEMFLDPKIRAAFPTFAVFPQCPVDKRWVEVDWSDPKPHQQPAEPSIPMSKVLELIPTLMKTLPIDPHRVYVMGLSMGGFGTWDIIARKPEWFAAAVPICGGADDSTAPRIARLPIWVFHGDKDPTVNPGRSRSMVAALKQAGGTPKYSELPGVNHDAWTPAFSNPELLPWLFAQKRH
jgi:poly(3-hydroxybutyrate) depolymerase